MAHEKVMKSAAKQEEKELLDAGLELFSSGFPNRDRIGCPNPSVIESMALRSLQLSLAERERWLDHMTICSPCFNQYHALVRKKRSRWRLTKMALCAALLVSGGVATWWGINRLHHQRGPRTEIQQAVQPIPVPKTGVAKNPQPPAVVAYTPMVLDLRSQAVTRGARSSTGKATIPSIPGKRLDLSIYLPVGSEEGEYQIRLMNRDSAILLECKGTATLVDGRTVLRAKMDLTQVPSGKYRIAVRQGQWDWAFYYLQLK